MNRLILGHILLAALIGCSDSSRSIHDPGEGCALSLSDHIKASPDVECDLLFLRRVSDTVFTDQLERV